MIGKDELKPIDEPKMPLEVGAAIGKELLNPNEAAASPCGAEARGAVIVVP
jgi:hypothetical protein